MDFPVSLVSCDRVRHGVLPLRTRLHPRSRMPDVKAELLPSPSSSPETSHQARIRPDTFLPTTQKPDLQNMQVGLFMAILRRSGLAHAHGAIDAVFEFEFYEI
jgi:hypothetical protein